MAKKKRNEKSRKKTRADGSAKGGRSVNPASSALAAGANDAEASGPPALLKKPMQPTKVERSSTATPSKQGGQRKKAGRKNQVPLPKPPRPRSKKHSGDVPGSWHPDPRSRAERPVDASETSPEPVLPMSSVEPRPPSPGDVGNILAVLADTTDPELRYELATAELAGHVQAIEQLSSIRADAVAAAYASNSSVRGLAQRLGVSPSRVHQLIQESKSRAAKAAVT